MSNPRISVNKLGEYVQITNALRRRQIVFDAKNPANFKSTRYSEAREFIKNYFIQSYDESLIERGIEMIKKKPVANDYQENDKKNSIFALELLIETDLPDLTGISIEAFNWKNSPVSIKGVDISVMPDLLLTSELRGKKVIGGIKLHVSKTYSLLEEGQKTVATVLRKFLEDNKQDEEDVDHQLCFSVDVFAQSCSAAPAAFRQRMKQVQAACEEIALRWENV